MADKGTQAGLAIGLGGNMVDKGTQTRPVLPQRTTDGSHFSQNRALHGTRYVPLKSFLTCSSLRKRDKGKDPADF